MDLSRFFFAGWSPIIRSFLMALTTYVTMVFLLRFTGKRVLTQMTPSDFIVPLALGPILASTILLQSISFVQGMTAFTTLVAVHMVVVWLSYRSSRFRWTINPRPVLLVYKGELIQGMLKKEKVPIEEILEALRVEKLGSMEEAEAIVLESDGRVTVIPSGQGGSRTSLHDVRGYPNTPGAGDVRKEFGLSTKSTKSSRTNGGRR
jgi:uncharacterized membrane protein YcaP (DUF421 family)